METEFTNPLVKIIECPRDAMQGIHQFIPTQIKIKYLNTLLKIGFDTLDFGSFVSPKAIPQMQDTAQVILGLDLSDSKSKLLAIVANYRGAEEACVFPEISYLGFPLSASETFQQRNTHKSISEALTEVARIQGLCVKKNKKMVLYISMGFGNPYGDFYDPEIIGNLVQKVHNLGIEIISFADTIASASPDDIEKLYRKIVPPFPEIEFGVHLHSRRDNAIQKMEAAWQAGCRRFDGALKGFGGCPMADDKLVGNMPTEMIMTFLKEKHIISGIDNLAFSTALLLTEEVFI